MEENIIGEITTGTDGVLYVILEAFSNYLSNCDLVEFLGVCVSGVHCGAHCVGCCIGIDVESGIGSSLRVTGENNEFLSLVVSLGEYGCCVGAFRTGNNACSLGCIVILLCVINTSCQHSACNEQEDGKSQCQQFDHCLFHWADRCR